MAAFSELGVMPEVVKAIEEIDWLLPTNIQAEAIPLILGGGDVLMAAETGSGKTGAFCLPVLQIVHETLRDRLEGKGEKQPSKGGMDEVLLNPYDRDPDLAISPDGLLCQSRDQRKWNGCRSSLGVMSGKHYFEATVTDEGLCRVGWATSAATLELGKDKFGFGFGGTGKKSFSGQFDDYGEPFGINDTIGIMIDLENHTISFAKNGNSLGKAFTIPEALHGEVFFAAVTLKNAEMKFNFGTSPFSGQPPPGYEALSSAKDLKAAKRKTKNQSGKNQRLPLALIVEPARELAQQTSDNIKQFGRHLTNPTLKSCLLIGGDRAKEQLKWLREGIDIVTGTPGKLDDMMTTGCLDLSEVSFFILDEVDGLLSGGHGQFIQKIFQQLPKVSSAGRRLQMIVCSATLHSLDVKKLADRLMYHPIWIDLKGQDSVPETVHHVVCKVDPVMDTQWHTLKKHIATDGIHQRDTVRPGMKSKEALSEGVKILKGQYLLQAITKHEMDQAIIFCRTKLDCDNVEKYLISLDGGRGMVNKYSCVCLHGDRKPQERKGNLVAFKNGEVRFLICTDVAARGIDIQGVPYVINVTLPDEKQNYLHRIGRVGRADRMGLAISLVSTVQEKVWYHSNCPNRGKGCWNTALTDNGGCAIWYNEYEYLRNIEEHLGETIAEVTKDLDVATNEFDGKVTYGSKRNQSGVEYASHVDQLAATVHELAQMERRAQGMFLTTYGKCT